MPRRTGASLRCTGMPVEATKGGCRIFGRHPWSEGNIKAKDKDSGLTVLRLTAFRGHEDVAQLLLEGAGGGQKADINAKDEEDETVPYLAAYKCHT